MMVREKRTLHGFCSSYRAAAIPPFLFSEVFGLIYFAGKPAIIAGEIKKGGNVLVLRDDNGVPVWAGWRR